MTRRCDRCGKETTGSYARGHLQRYDVEVKRVEGGFVTRWSLKPGADLVLCPVCFSGLQAWLKTGEGR